MNKLATILALFLFFICGAIVYAHGGGQLIAGPVQTGPYLLSVWVNPPQPRSTEPLHFTVGVAEPVGRSPVLDAQILVTLQPQTVDAPQVTAEATTEQSINRLFYETDMIVDQPDRYQATFDVAGPEGEGQLTIDLDVIEPSQINWFLLGLAGLALVIVLGWWRARRAGGNSAAK